MFVKSNITRTGNPKSSVKSFLCKTMKLLLLATTAVTAAFQPSPLSKPHTSTNLFAINEEYSLKRRSLMTLMASGNFFSNIFGDGGSNNIANASIGGTINAGKGPTNEVVKAVNGMKLRRLGGSDILVSELGLGAQRWYVHRFIKYIRSCCCQLVTHISLTSLSNIQTGYQQTLMPQTKNRYSNSWIQPS